jgi:hypothetical protein
MKRWRAAPETWFASSLQAILAVLAIAAAYQLCVSYGIGLPIKPVDADRAKLSTEIALAYPLHCPWSFLDGKIHKDRLLRDSERI